jgi:hypothetical protein
MGWSRVSLSDGMIDVAHVPEWILWILACLALSIFAGSVLRVLAPAVRRGRGVRSVAVGAAIFLVWAALSRSPREVLLVGSTGFFTSALPLLWMGPLPADMPSAKDPAVRQHPRYKEVQRRGKIAGFAIVFLSLGSIILAQLLFRGV